MRINEFKAALSQQDFGVTEIPGSFVICHESVDVSNPTDPFYINDSRDAVISADTVGAYTVAGPIPNTIADLIRRFANTPLNERKPEVKQYFVAIAGKDLNTANHFHNYTAYMDDLQVDDATKLSELKNSPRYHLNKYQKSKLETITSGEGLPKPLFIDVRDVDDVLDA